MSFMNTILQTYRQGNAVIRLIYINVAVFVLLQAVIILMKLFNVSGDFLLYYLAMPAQPALLLSKPWTLFSYMFLHRDFFHLLFNMVALYWFGKIFVMFYTDKQLVGLYILGGLSGGIMYLLSYNVFPLFTGMTHISILLGASGSITAIILASAVQAPDLQMRLLLLGAIKLKFIAIAVVLISFFGITSSNAGGELAHLGGALYGYIFIVSLRRGKDHTRWISRLIDAVYTLFKPRKLKVKPGKTRSGKMDDGEFNIHKAATMAEIDRILDKIKASGYSSLTDQEKKRLFDQNKK